MRLRLLQVLTLCIGQCISEFAITDMEEKSLEKSFN